MPFLEYIPEPDLVWFANYDPYDMPACSGGIHEGVRPIDYRLYRDFFIQRVNMRLEVSSKIDALRLDMQNDIARLSLSYKIGEAILINTKHGFGYLRLPIILYYINKQHRQQGICHLDFYETNNKGIDSVSKIGLSYMKASKQGLKEIFKFLSKELPKLKLEVK